jgi:hypothetical protein
MLGIEWFAQHLNYQGFVGECQNLFGKNKVSAFKYQGDVVREVALKLGLATPYDNPTPRQNKSLNSASIALLKTINQYDLKPKDKELLMPHLKQIDEILNSCEPVSLIDDESRKRILEVSRPIKF